MINKWNFQTPSEEELHKRDQLVAELGFSPVICLLLVQRGITSIEEAKKFFKPSLNDLHDPFLMPDMDKAVRRLNKALGNKEKILIYGDYDVDGTTAVSLVFKYLRPYSSTLDFYIPDRYDEGYGISYKGIDYAAENGVSLVISLDCGIKAIEKIEYAKEKGIDFIICDHHMPDATLPDAVAVLDAKRSDSIYPYEHLSGCGVGFKFMQAFAKSNNFPFSDLEKLLELTAVSIASDIVPITGENRILAYYGLKQLNSNPSLGLKGIIDICGLTGKEITISDIVFKIGPRINASGRMMNGKEAVELLLSKDSASAREKSESINQYNEERRELDKKITDEANAVIDEVENMDDRKAIVVYRSVPFDREVLPSGGRSYQIVRVDHRIGTFRNRLRYLQGDRELPGFIGEFRGTYLRRRAFPSGGEPRGIHRAFLEDRIRGDHTGADDPADRYRRYLGFERDQPEVRERPKEDEPVRAGQPKARILFAWRKGLRHQ